MTQMGYSIFCIARVA